jgi:hypothetical protein
VPARTPFYRHRLFDVIDREPVGTVRLLPDTKSANRVVAQQKTGIHRRGREPTVVNPLVAGSSPARPHNCLSVSQVALLSSPLASDYRLP